MAIPSLQEKAALTLFHNPHMQPEDWSVDYAAWSTPARAIQRWWRRRGVLNRAATRINALMRAFSVRCFIAGYNRRETLLSTLYRRYSLRLTPHVLRGGRRYLGLRRASFGLGPAYPGMYQLTGMRYQSTNLETLETLGL